MALWQSKYNPHTGEMTIVRGESALHMKASVSAYASLPITGNEENDVRIAQDTDLMWTWSISATSGLITNWTQIGSASSVDWSAITNKPSSSTADIDDAVSKKHSQNTDTGTSEASFIINSGGTHAGAILEHEITTNYALDFLTGGTASADTQWNDTRSADKATDDDTETWWNSNGSSTPHWWKYDLGVGNEKIARRFRFYQRALFAEDYTLKGSNNNTSWTTLLTVTGGASGIGWREHDFSNSTAYRYYMYTVTSVIGAEPYGHLVEVELQEAIGLDGITFKEGNASDALIEIQVSGTLTNLIKDENGDNASSPADIADAVSKKHTAGADENITIDVVPATDVTASGVKASFTAGESLVFGDVCYVKSDGKLWKADASLATTASAVAIALATISADASGSFLMMGVVRDDSWTWTVGGLLYLSATAGAVTQTAPSTSGDQVQILGVATHADRILFKPELVQVEVA